jgi:hypothetical protein
MLVALLGKSKTLSERLKEDRDCLRALKRELQREVKRKEKELKNLDIIIDNAFHYNKLSEGRRKLREQVRLEKSVERYSQEMAQLDDALEVTDIQRIKIATQQAMIRTTRVLTSMLQRYPNSAMSRIMAMYAISSDVLAGRQQEIQSTYEGVLDATNVPDGEEEEGNDEESMVATRYAQYCDAHQITNYHAADSAISEARETQKLKEEDDDLERRLMQLSPVKKRKE